MINSIEKTAIERIRFAHDIAMHQTGHKPFICISGGKDSSIVQHLAYKSGIDCMFIHFLTSVDAPETVRFVKSQFEKLRSEGLEAKILRPKKKRCGNLSKIEICPLYAEGWKRCSCIGCPLGNRRQRTSQWLRWPGMKRAWVAAIERGLKKVMKRGNFYSFIPGKTCSI